MPTLSKNLELSRCPHCGVAKPYLEGLYQFETRDHAGDFQRRWWLYICRHCGGAVTAWSSNWQNPVMEVFPDLTTVDADLPDRVRAYLQQAHESIHAPSGAVMLAASAVDAMLKEKGYLKGTLYARIDQAIEAHLITADMGKWAHEVRLDANDERHADVAAVMPAEDDARRAVEFASALGQFLFVLPARVRRGLEPGVGA